MEESERKFRRIGIRIVKQPGQDFIMGHNTEIYDVDTGDFLPAVKADLHFDAEKLVTATLELEVAEVEVINGNAH